MPMPGKVMEIFKKKTLKSKRSFYPKTPWSGVCHPLKAPQLRPRHHSGSWQAAIDLKVKTVVLGRRQKMIGGPPKIGEILMKEPFPARIRQ